MEAENSQFCVSIYCVIPSQATEATCPKELFQAYECCKDNNFNVSWMQEEDCLKFKPCKEDVFIFSEFVGPSFEFLRKSKSTIIGPQCLLVSVQKGEPIPELPYPVFTIGMKNLVITTTGCTAQEKKEIQEKIQFMGGIYSASFLGTVTHLIVKSVADFSQKFKVAIQKDIPVMIPTWVDAVWSASQKENVHATDRTFAKHACPPFQGLVVCVSQMPVKEREALKRLIDCNGGHYSGQLEMNKTNVLITTSAEGDKYTYARRWKIRCLKPEWIHDSLNKGYAVNPEEYIVEKSNLPPRCSTPEADHSIHAMKFGNASINSTIVSESRIQKVDETLGSTMTILNHQQSDSRTTEALDSLDLAMAKKAGPFLDGCKIFLSGFHDPQVEKLKRLFNIAGVARFNTISESLTHVIAGKGVEEDLKQLQQLIHKPHVVTVEWVVQSLRLKRVAPEAGFLHPDFKALVAQNKETAVKKSVPEHSANAQEDTRMVQQYLNSNHSEDEEEVASLMSRPSGLFSGLTFQLVGLDNETSLAMNDVITGHGGRVVTKNPAYILSPPIVQALDLERMGVTVVNTFWIEECIEEEQLVEIEIYHKPVRTINSQRLSGLVVSFSGVQGRLRDLLGILINHLGGRPQETFSRKLMEEKNVYRSTHLVCEKPEGKKYEKALEWGVPAVDPKWIIACATLINRPSEEDYPPGCESVKIQEPNLEIIGTTKTVEPAESIVLKSAKQNPAAIKTSDTASRFPAHFEMSSPQTPMVRSAATPVVMPHLRPSLSDTPTGQVILTNTLGKTPQTRSALFNMPTPETPYGRLLNPDPSPDTRKMWKYALDNRVRLTPGVDDVNSNAAEKQREGGQNAMEHGADGYSGYFENFRKKLKLDDSVHQPSICKTEEKNNAETPKLPPFHGVVAFIHKKIEDQRSELVRAVETLGGRVRFQHCDEVTHFVYQGKLPASKEIRAAKDWHQKFVSPQWILDCEDCSFRLEESQYPTSLNPKMALSLNFSSQPAPPASTQKRRHPANCDINTQETHFEKKRFPSDSASREPATNEEQNILTSEVEEEACKELLQLDQVLSRSAEQIPLQKMANVSTRNGRNSDHVFVPATQPLEMVHDSQQSAAVVWDLHETQKITSSQSAPVYRIMFSGMAPTDRDRCTSIIENLGGTVIETTNYDPTCSHLVVSKVGCNEKLLNSIAAGKWVLNPEWLNESEKENRFVEESKYEWGNPTATFMEFGSDISEDEIKIAAAAHYWRLNRSRGLSDGPFHGITAILHLREKNACFQRLLEAGGGEVVEQESGLEQSKTNLCIVDTRAVKKLDLSVFATKGIYCVPILYLRNLVLAMDKKLKWSECVVPEYLPYLENMPL